MSEPVFYFIGTRPNTLVQDGKVYVSDNVRDLIGVQAEDINTKLFDQYSDVRPTASHQTGMVSIRLGNSDLIKAINKGEDATGRVFDLSKDGAAEEAKAYLYERRAVLCDEKAMRFSSYRMQYVDVAGQEHEKAVALSGKKSVKDIKNIAKKGRKAHNGDTGKPKNNGRV